MSSEAEFLPPANVVDALRAIQEEHGWLEPEAVRAYAERTSTPMYRLHGVASFFPNFRREKPPRCELSVCRDAACWLRGAADLAGKSRWITTAAWRAHEDPTDATAYD